MRVAQRENSDHTVGAERPLSVLLIDSQLLFNEALASALRRALPIAECAFAQSAADAMLRLRVSRPDIVIANSETLDQQLNRIVSAAAPAPVIATANSIEKDKVLHALAAGVSGYLPKSMSGDAICGAIRLALDGGVCLPPEALSAVIAPEPRKAAHRTREFEILGHLARGASNKAIARELGLSVGTVKLHVQAILRSTGARNRVEAIVNARRMGMLSG